MVTEILTSNDITLYRSERVDSCGNPRVIVHFYAFIEEDETKGMDILQKHAYALRKAKTFGKKGWRNYKAKEFGGGFICQYDYCGGREILKDVERIRSSRFGN